MITPLEPSQLADRIRLAARQASGGQRRVTADSIARGELPPVPEPLPPPSAPVRRPGSLDKPSVSEHPLEEAADMVPRARRKIEVSDSVPGLLRPLLRNQGGFNHILLEALDRLVEVNRQLQRQNQELHERLVTMHTWMNQAAHASSLDRDWMQAVENRLRGISEERLVALETRIASSSGESPAGNPVDPAAPEPPESSTR